MSPVPAVVVDCDPGVDDALALLALAAHHHDGRIRLVAVSTVAGNADVRQCARNARYVLDGAGLARVPVVAGAAEPLVGGQAVTESRHGSDGLGGCYRPRHGTLIEEAEEGALSRAVEVAGGAAEGPLWLLALGPLTNLAHALASGEGVLERFERVVAMGGALDVPGGIGGHAEFNLWADPHAAERVLHAGLPLTLVPLDVTTRALLPAGRWRSVLPEESTAGSAPRCSLTTELLVAAERRHEGKGEEGWALHDPLAAAVLMDPTLVTLERTGLGVDADRHSDTLGRLNRDESAPPVDVAVAVDAERARRAMLDPLFETQENDD